MGDDVTQMTHFIIQASLNPQYASSEALMTHFTELLTNNCEQFINELINTFSNSQDRNIQHSTMILLGRIASLAGKDLPKLIQQQCLMDLFGFLINSLQNESYPDFIIDNITECISRYAEIFNNYNEYLNDLPFNLLSAITESTPQRLSAYILDCLSKCINTRSINVNTVLNELIAKIDFLLAYELDHFTLVCVLRLIYSIIKRINTNNNQEIIFQLGNVIIEKIVIIEDQYLGKALIDLTNFIDSYSEKAFSNNTNQIYQALCQLLESHDINDEIIGNVLYCIIQLCVDFKENFNDRSISILDLLFSIVAKTPFNISKEEEQMNGSNLRSIAIDCLDTLSNIYGGSINFMNYAIYELPQNNFNNSDPIIRLTVFVVLSKILDNCSHVFGFYEEDNDEFILLMLNGLKDDDQYCLFMAIKALRPFLDAYTSYLSVPDSVSQSIYNTLIYHYINSQDEYILTESLHSLTVLCEKCIKNLESMHSELLLHIHEKFPISNPNQQKYMVRIFSSFALQLKEQIGPYIHFISDYMIPIITNPGSVDNNLFFCCLTNILSFKGIINENDYKQIINIIIDFICNVDFSDLNSKERDQINYVIRKILTNCPQQMEQTIQAFYGIVYTNANVDLYFQELPLSSNILEYTDNHLVIHDDNKLMIYDYAQLREISEAIITICTLIKIYPALAADNTSSLIELFFKWISFHQYKELTAQCFNLLSLVLKSIDLDSLNNYDSLMINSILAISHLSFDDDEVRHKHEGISCLNQILDCLLNRDKSAYIYSTVFDFVIKEIILGKNFFEEITDEDNDTLDFSSDHFDLIDYIDALPDLLCTLALYSSDLYAQFFNQLIKANLPIEGIHNFSDQTDFYAVGLLLWIDYSIYADVDQDTLFLVNKMANECAIKTTKLQLIYRYSLFLSSSKIPIEWVEEGAQSLLTIIGEESKDPDTFKMNAQIIVCSIICIISSHASEIDVYNWLLSIINYIPVISSLPDLFLGSLTKSMISLIQIKPEIIQKEDIIPYMLRIIACVLYLSKIPTNENISLLEYFIGIYRDPNNKQLINSLNLLPTVINYFDNV